jgi:hypothetical protein
MGGNPVMSRIIAAKYGGPCAKCGKKIKAGRFVNWERDRGIWHLNKIDNKELGHVESGCRPNTKVISPDTHHKEEKTMDLEEKIEVGMKIVDPNGDDDTINVSDLIKALQGMVGKVAKPPATEVVEPRAKRKYRGRSVPLTDKQISFCELMALGSDGATAYTDSYDVSNPAFSNTAARRLLSQEKIKNKISELSVELGGGDVVLEDMPTVAALLNPPYGESTRAARGWAVKLTRKQEKFCQIRAGGSTLAESFKRSGYHTVNWTERRIRRESNRLMKLQKVKDRIADIVSGCAPDIEVAIAGEDSHKVPRTGTGPGSKIREGTMVGTTSAPVLVELTEFVDNFVELIKAHGRLFHHAVVTRGQ